MSLTRKFLKELGIADDAAEQIITEHTTTTARMMDELQEAQDEAANVAAIQQEVDTLKGFQTQYETEKAAHDALRAEVDAASTAKAKTDALRAYFESKNITGDKIPVAMRAVSLESIEMDGDKIKDTTALDALVAGDLKPLTVSDGQGKGTKKSRTIDSGAKSGVNDHGSGKPDYSLQSALREKYSP